MNLPLFCLLAVPALLAQTPAPVVSTAAAAAPRHFDKVMIVMLENTNFGAARNEKFLSSLAKRGALLTRYRAISHPSEPNYVAIISGDTQGIKDDSNVDLDAPNIGDLLEAKGLAWKSYAEAYPGGCDLKARSDTFARKHEPFLSFKSIQKDPARCARVVNAEQLDKDIKNGTLPQFSLFIPDMNDDGHDTGVKYADKWLEKAFGKRLEDPKFTQGMLFVVTFDEDAGLDNRVLTVLTGDMIKPGYESKQPYTHYSLLRTVEDNFGLGNLSKNDVAAKPFVDVWK